MGNASAKETIVQSEPNSPPANLAGGGEKKLKPCCACPETKRARDDCIINNGQESCGPQIEAHKQCMRKMGFNI